MPRQVSEMYAILESPNSKTSTGPTNVQTFSPASGKRAVGVWISVETTSARVTFDGTSPGNATGPGLVIPKDAVPQFFPFPFDGAASNFVVSAVAAAAGSSLVSVMFVF